MEEKPFRIAIIGGGIGGLCFANSLAKLLPDHHSRFTVDIYESTSSLEAQVGAGIGLWPYSWSVMEFLGFDKELLQRTGQDISGHNSAPLFAVRRSDKEENQDLFTLTTKGGGLVLLHRADFQSVLLRNIPSSFRIHTKKRLRTYTNLQDEILLHFEDSSTARCDFVVGADGLQSSVRRTMMKEFLQRDKPPSHSRSNGEIEERYFHQLSNPHWMGSIVYRELIPAQKIIDAGWPNHRVFTEELLNIGRNSAVLAYPVRGGELINFFGFKTWPHLEGTICEQKVITELILKEVAGDGITQGKSNEEQDSNVSNIGDDEPWAQNGGGGRSGSRNRWVTRVHPRELRDCFRGWAPDVRVLVDQLEAPLRWSIHGTYPLPTFRGKRACLLGDAAHAMVPNTGQGASQSISDAFVLANLVAYALEDQSCDVRNHLDALLSAYDEIRRPAGQDIAVRSRKNGYNWVLLSEDADGQFTEFDLDTPDKIEAFRQRTEYNWSPCWEKQGPFKEAARAINIFKRSTVPPSARTG